VATAASITVDVGRAASRIRVRLPRMSEAMKKIAALVIDDPAALLELGITDVASRAGTSAATVSRFCRLLGYSGYVQFRVGLASELGRDDAYASWRTDIGREFDPRDPPNQLLRALRGAQERALDQTAELIDLSAVARIAEAIWTCDHLDIYGVVGSAAMASELQGRLYRIGVNAHAWGEVHQGLASAAILSDRSVAIGISNSGRTNETIEMREVAKSSGAFTVAITGNPDAPLAMTADACLVNATATVFPQPDDLLAKHSQLLVLDLLHLLVAQRDYAVTAERLTRSRLAVTSHRRPAGDRDMARTAS
jgi:DNA-binding MurR/RpiR family transcriptional regulator